MSELPPNDPVTPNTPIGEPSPAAAVPALDAATLGDPADVQKNKMMAVLAYIGILVLIPIFAAKESRFARYHANQGLILLIASFAGGICIMLVSIMGIFLHAIAICGGCVLGPLLWLGVVILAIMGIMNAVKGKMVPLPLIGQYKILK